MARWWVCFLSSVALMALARGANVPANVQAPAEFRVERLEISGGAELLTVFGRMPDLQAPYESLSPAKDVPLVSVLRDCLGDDDPANDRLRYVWILSSASPTLLQRAASAVPFFYWRANAGKHPDRRPVPVFDLGHPSRTVWTSAAGALTQVAALDPRGSAVRASTRSFRNNYADHRRLHLFEGYAVLSRLHDQLDDQPGSERVLTEPELTEVQARLALAAQPLGGLVSGRHLPEAYMKQRVRDDEARGHNWDLLRQKAEADGLYFEPIHTGSAPALALLWIAREDLHNPPPHYDGQFLGFANPYNDDRLLHWTGYHSVRDGHDLIPLGLYSLEYPKVPLLVVDFRDTNGPKRREMFRRAATDAVSGVLGISMWSNWPVLAGFSSWNFIRGRHGAATDRPARIRAYSQTRQWVAFDASIEPALRASLMKHLETLGINPLDDSIFDEGKLARLQYAELLKYASDPHGLAARLEHDRNAELEAYHHRFATRFWFLFGHYASLGAYRHQEATPAAAIAELGEIRRVRQQVEFLTQVADSSAEPSIAWNMERLRGAIEDLSASGFPEQSDRVVRRLLKETSDQETRRLCESALWGWEGDSQ